MGLLGCSGVVCLLFFCSFVVGMGKEKEGVHPVLVSGAAGPISRSVYSLDFGWKFFLYPQSDLCTNSSDPFPNKLTDKQCYGLNQVTTATTSQECEQACCQQLGCYIWQFCQNSSCTPANSCWVGVSSDCGNYNAGWISGAANLPPAPTNSCNVAECAAGFDDSSWRTLNLPHDFVIEGTFSPYAQRSHAYLPTGTAWYRLHFNLPAGSEGASIWLTFDGIYRNSVTFLNGEYLGTHPSGYTSFIYDISNQTSLNFGGPNVLAIYVDATQFEGWWYEGGGIYRHVWLTVADPLHVKPWGLFAPSVITGEISNVSNGQFATEAVVYFETDIINTRTQIETFTLISSVADDNGKSLGSVSSTVTLIPQQETNVAQTLIVENVNLWSAESPTLYNVTTSIVASGVTIDTVVTTIGIRKVVFDVDQGLFINNNPVKINGVCNHQDFAGTGTAVPNRVNEFRVLKLKEMGINGWRMSHNPPNPELLDFTDQYGIYVMDENRNFANYSQYFSDMELMVLRDRNHPSIIMWSVCNEVGCMEGDPAGAVVGAAFKAIAKNADPSRVVAAAMNNDWGVGLSMVLDAQGVNYNYQVYPTYHNTHDYQPMFGSETASCLGARSIYVTNATACHLAIYNTDGCINQWTHAVQGAPYIAGGFSWTGFDYKGEPTPYNWPDVNSNFGTIDLAGFPKDTFWFYQSWYTNLTVLHLFPHWNWEVGDNVSVWAYTNAASVELFVDGISQGVQSIPYLGRAGWNVVWKGPGTIEAKAYNVNKTVIANQTITTTGTPYAIGLTVETPSTIAADGQDVALIAVSILDQNGLIVPTASNYVNFTVTSNGAILGVGNGDPSCLEPDKASGRSAFGGLARVIVQSLQGVTGTIALVAQSEGLQPAKIAITAQ